MRSELKRAAMSAERSGSIIFLYIIYTTFSSRIRETGTDFVDRVKVASGTTDGDRLRSRGGTQPDGGYTAGICRS